MELGLLTLGDHRTDPASGSRTTQVQKPREILDYIEFAAPGRCSGVRTDVGDMDSVGAWTR